MGGKLLKGGKISRDKVPEIISKVSGEFGKYFEEVLICGSYRRGKAEVGDIDIVVVVDKNMLMEFGMMFKKKYNVPWTYVKKSILVDSIQVEINICIDRVYLGAMVLYATGSGGFNARMRLRAAERGLKLNRYGLWKGSVRVAGSTEEGIFKVLGFPWTEPSERR